MGKSLVSCFFDSRCIYTRLTASFPGQSGSGTGQKGEEVIPLPPIPMDPPLTVRIRDAA